MDMKNFKRHITKNKIFLDIRLAFRLVYNIIMNVKPFEKRVEIDVRSKFLY